VGSSLNGADGNDTLIGGAWDDTLIGGNGADSMAGGTKNDSYVVDNAGDVVTEAPGEGIDTVASSISYTLSANVEKLTLSGTASINGTGNDLDNEITGNTGANQLSGGNGHDLLTGLSGNDTLIGGAGNDTLDGGLDQDSMAGGTGDDTYVVERLSDVVTEVAGEGIDTIKTWVSLALPDNVENLWLVDTNAVTGTGNALDNVITGEGGNNVLSGGDGNDTLDGLLGEDTLVGGAGSDSFQFSTAPGTFSFGSNIDVITDFDASQDQIRLSHVFFTALNLGVVDASAFTIGTAATTASQRIVYDDTTGSLYYDADGNGALAAKQVATLVGPTGTLSAGDFLVY
jgi:Ca2+-binding RTX toxin-like protein